MGEWRLIAATSGHLDERPRIAWATVRILRRRRGRLAFAAQVRAGSRVRHIRGLVPLKPALTRPSSWLPGLLWVLASPFHVQLHMGESGNVVAAVTPGSMLMNPGIALFARAELDPASAHRTLELEAMDLDLSFIQLREMIWRITVPGTDSRRFEEQTMDDRSAESHARRRPL